MRSALSLLLLLSACGESRPPVYSSPSLTDVPMVSDGSSPEDVSMASDASSDVAPAACASYVADENPGALSSPLLNETSGIVESTRQRGVFFVHNDSGDRARFFAVDATGALLAEYRLPGATAVDWEDVAIGPCDAGTCLYFADLGDNDLTRDDYQVLRVPEPEVRAVATTTHIDVPWTALPLRYPDGRHNAETLVADPQTGDLYVVTKVERGLSTVFFFSRSAHGAAVSTLAPVGQLPLPSSAGVLVTGGSVAPNGRALLIRTYLKLYLYERAPEDPFSALFRATPAEVAVRAERQGEAVAWRTDGRGYATVSEGAGARLNLYHCADP